MISLRYKLIYSVSFVDSGPTFTNGVYFSADSSSHASLVSKRFLKLFL